MIRENVFGYIMNGINVSFQLQGGK